MIETKKNSFWGRLAKEAIKRLPATVRDGINTWQKEMKFRKDIELKEQRIEGNRLLNQRRELQNEKLRLEIAELRKKLGE